MSTLLGGIRRRGCEAQSGARYWPGLMAALLLSAALTPAASAARTPQESAKLTAPDAAGYDYFGSAVALSGDTVVIGAPYDDHVAGTDAGSAYVFVRAGGAWTQQAKLTAADAAEGGLFGISAAISGDTVVIGACGDGAGGTYAGAAYVFVCSGRAWTQQAKLTAGDAAAGDFFGYSLAISGDTAVIGAFRDDHGERTDAGSAYVFVRSGGVWTQQAKLTAADAAARDQFGVSVALSGDTAVIGAQYNDNAGGSDAGAAYVFARAGGVWTQQAKLTAADGTDSDLFGVSVALAGDTAVVGAWNDNLSGEFHAVGSAYVFVQSGGAWTEQAKLIAADAAGGSFFGYAVAAAGDAAVIGAWDDDHAGGYDAGAAYLFVRAGGVWTQQAKLVASDSADNDLFGVSVAISGNTAVIGSYADDHAGGSDAGSAYVFDLNCLGACCQPDGSCAVTSEEACAGAWHAEWVDCLVAQCSPPLDGDFDGDGHVDVDDYAFLADCLAGPAGDYPPGCGRADLDGDVDVDLADFAAFQAAFTGP